MLLTASIATYNTMGMDTPDFPSPGAKAWSETQTSPADLEAFETATRDLVGLALRSVASLEVSLPQYRLLLVLHERGRSSSVQVAQTLGIVGSSVTRLADRLRDSGHLKRGADPANRSIVTLELTAKGRRLVTRVRTRRRAELRRVLDQMDPQERSICAAGLRSVHEGLDNGNELEQSLSLTIPL